MQREGEDVAFAAEILREQFVREAPTANSLRHVLIFVVSASAIICATLLTWAASGHPVSDQSKLWYFPLIVSGGLLAAALVKAFDFYVKRQIARTSELADEHEFQIDEVPDSGAQEGRPAEGGLVTRPTRQQTTAVAGVVDSYGRAIETIRTTSIWESYLTGKLSLEDKETLPALIKELHREIAEHLGRSKQTPDAPES
jgi:hypothetical protein